MIKHIAALALCLGAAFNAQAVVINLDVSDNHGHYSGTAAASDPGTYWNLADAAGGPNSTYSDLTASDGSTATSVDIGFRNWISEHNWIGSNTLSDRMYGPATGSAFIDFSDLAAGTAYDIYLYASDHNTQYSAPGVAPEIASSNGQSANWGAPWTEGLEYVLLEDVIADGSGNITVTASAFGGATTWTSIAGIQIEGASTSSSIPGPAPLALIALGLTVLTRRKTNISGNA